MFPNSFKHLHLLSKLNGSRPNLPRQPPLFETPAWPLDSSKSTELGGFFEGKEGTFDYFPTGDGFQRVPERPLAARGPPRPPPPAAPLPASRRLRLRGQAPGGLAPAVSLPSERRDFYFSRKIFVINMSYIKHCLCIRANTSSLLPPAVTSSSIMNT